MNAQTIAAPKPLEIIVGQVSAVTKPRQNKLGATNIGVLVKDLDNSSKDWHNCYNDLGLTYGDYVRVEVHVSYSVITKVSREDTEF